jgi:ferredoxin
MANTNNRNSKNIEGAWFCTDPNDASGEGCIACAVCYNGAPDFFESDDSGNAYVKKQPTTDEEIALCQEQLESCPVNSIGK